MEYLALRASTFVANKKIRPVDDFLFGHRIAHPIVVRSPTIKAHIFS